MRTTIPNHVASSAMKRTTLLIPAQREAGVSTAARNTAHDEPFLNTVGAIRKRARPVSCFKLPVATIVRLAALSGALSRACS